MGNNTKSPLPCRSLVKMNKIRCMAIVAGFIALCVAYVFLSNSETSTFLLDGGPNSQGGQPECGEVCSYGGIELPGKDSTHTRIRKRFNCDTIMRRMAYRDHMIKYPPPKETPPEMYDEFTQMGEMPVKGQHYFIGFTAGSSTGQTIIRNYSGEQLEKISERLNQGENINSYKDDMCMINLLRKLKIHIQSSSSVVIGTQVPWLEVTLLSLQAAHVTTLEYGNLNFMHADLDVYSPYVYAEKFLEHKTQQFDFGASFSSLEHSGLGRYGDPINPYGDLEAMAQNWCLLKPGGLFVVGVPGTKSDKGSIFWNAHRVYGFKRLNQLMANWDLVDRVWCNDKHVVSVLRKE